ncbi:MAG: MFS transporter [Solirubrobacteraceae bacterium]
MRPLAWGGWTSAVGSGLWFTIWALFLTRRVALTGPQAGIALSVAGIVGFLSPTPLGRLADRRGPREVYGVLLAAEGVFVVGFLFCHTFAEVVLVASATAACDQGKTGVRAALIAQLAPEEDRVAALACLRACSHAGDALGAGLGALVIGLDSGTAYGAAIVFNAISYLAYAGGLLRVPHVPPCAIAPRRLGVTALCDLPFVTLAAICGFLTLCWGLMSAGLPLWIAGHTHAPHALAGVIVLISSVAIAGLQVRFSRGVDTPSTAATSARRSGASLCACCGLVALAAGPDGLGAIALLLAAAVLHVLGELWFVAASWGLSVPFMPPDRPAEYQGVFATGEALAIMLAPALMTAVIVPGGTAGWLALGAAFALIGAMAQPAARWTVRTRGAGQLGTQSRDQPEGAPG